MNKIADALKALPSNLTWAQAMDLVGRSVLLPLWQISGKVSCNDEMTHADRYRLADAIVKQQTSAKKEEITMTSTDEAAATMFADTEQRQFLLMAAKHRKQLAQSDTESIFDIAARLREQVADARAADTGQRRPEATTFDASGHRPGWRLPSLVADAKRRKKYQSYDPEGRESGTTEEREDDSGDRRHDRRRKEATAHVRDPEAVEEEALSNEAALSDAEKARAEYLGRLQNSWKTCGR